VTFVAKYGNFTFIVRSYIGDYGANLIKRKDRVKTVVRAKRYKLKVDIKAIQEAVTAKEKYGCSDSNLT